MMQGEGVTSLGLEGGSRLGCCELGERMSDFRNARMMFMVIYKPR